MNHIARLQADLAAQKARADALESGIHDFWLFVRTSPKFGNRPILDADGLPILYDPNEERLDWIATGDVAARLSTIVQAGQDAANEMGV